MLKHIIFKASYRWYNVGQVRTVRVEKRINDIVNRLNKTKVERKPDLKGKFYDLNSLLIKS